MHMYMYVYVYMYMYTYMHMIFIFFSPPKQTNKIHTSKPDGLRGLRGLNAYAELIAGPGQYTFLSGTAGGGFVIRPDRPTDTELASLPVEVRNALRYAQNKEQLTLQ